VPKIPIQIAQKGRETRPHGLFSGGQLSSYMSSVRAMPVRLRPVLGNVPPKFGAEQGRNFERALKMIDNNIERRAAYNNALWVHEKSASSKKQWMEWIDDAQSKGELELVDRFREEYSKYVNDVVNTADNVESRNALQKELDLLGLRLLGQSMHLEARNRSQDTIIRLNQLIRTSSDIVAISSNPKEDLKDQQEKLKDNIASALAAGKITRKMADSFNSSISNLSAEAVDYLSTKDPQLAKEILDAAKDIPMHIRATLERRIQAASKKHDSLFRAQQEELLKNNITQIKDFGQANQLFNLEIYKSATSAGRAHNAKSLIDQSYRFFSAKSEMEGQSNNQIDKTMAKYIPKKGSRSYFRDKEAFLELVQWAKRQKRQLANDSFTYVLQDTTLKEQADSLSKADPETQAIMTEKFIDNNLDHQKELEIPDGRRSVAPLDVLKSTAANLNYAEPAQALQTLQQLSLKYGKHFPKLIGNMSSLSGDKKIDTVTQIAAHHMGKPWIIDFLNASRIKESEFAIPSEDMSDIKKRVATHSDVIDFTNSLLSTDSSPERMQYANDFNEAVRRQAMLHASKGMSIRKAITLASDQIISDSFAFGESSDKTYAISRQYVGRSGNIYNHDNRDIAKIRRILDMQLERAELPWYEPASDFKGLDPKDIDLKRLNADIRMRPEDLMSDKLFWATSEDMNGVTLFAPGVGENAQRVYSKKTGKSIKFTFEELILTYDNWLIETKKPDVEKQIEFGQMYPAYHP